MEPDEKQKAEPFLRDMDFAFFAVRFGWSISEYERMTPVQRRFVLKEIEDETVRQSNLEQSVHELAIANTHRKKSQSHRKLWKKKQVAREAPIPAGEWDALKAAFAARAKKKGGAGNVG